MGRLTLSQATPMNFQGWGYQDFSAGEIYSTNVTITKNQNGNSIAFNPSKIINNTAVIVLKSNGDEKAYSGTTKLFSSKVEVSSQDGVNIVLNFIPNTSWGDLRIYYYYTYNVIPVNYSIAPSTVSADLFNEIDGLFVTEDELNAKIIEVGGGGSADLISYDNVGYPSIENVQNALDQILYVAPSVTSFTNNIGNVEKGQIITSVNLSWSVNKNNIVSQSIDQGIGSLVTDVRNYGLIDQNITTNKTWTITISDGQNSATKSTSINFYNKRYYGVSPNTTLTDSDILAMSGEFSSSRIQNRIFDCTGGNYFYFAYPSSFGTATFKVGGLSFSDVVLSVQSFTNASDYTENYNVYRCGNLQTGSSILVEVF